MSKHVIFDEVYYSNLMKDFGYNPMDFEKINFSIGNMSEDDLQRRWLCHHNGKVFSDGVKSGEKSIMSTGIGLSGTPHIGTLSQILRSITIQKSGLPVNMVLGDLDAYNGKSVPLKKSRKLAYNYKEFILSLGFKESGDSILRSQYESLDVLRTSYIIGHYMEDDMFNKSEEDLHDFYRKRGAVDDGMSYRRKLSLNLMTSDFINLGLNDGFENVIVMLGIDEHKYVRFGMDVLDKIHDDKNFDDFKMKLSGMYSPMIIGLNGYPKMSKSFPNSGIYVDTDPEKIRRRVINGDSKYTKPENNVVYQMMSSASLFDKDEIRKNYDACVEGGIVWERAKKEYAGMLVEICSKWRNRHE